MRRSPLMLGLLLLTMAGCSRGAPPSSTLGRTLGAGPVTVRRAPTPTGDPPAERGGTVPKGHIGARDTPVAGSAAPSPQIALRRYALAYTNWAASSLLVRERQLAAMSIGSARLAAEQTAASQSAIASLQAHHVENRGVVVAIAPGEGPVHGQWVVVTMERTTGTGAYAGLPATLHVIFARVIRVELEWVVCEWRPRT